MNDALDYRELDERGINLTRIASQVELREFY